MDSSELLHTNDLAMEKMVNGYLDSTALSSYDQNEGSNNLEDAEDKDGDVRTTLDSKVGSNPLHLGPLVIRLM